MLRTIVNTFTLLLRSGNIQHVGYTVLFAAIVDILYIVSTASRKYIQ